jgi:hypothetical protein
VFEHFGFGFHVAVWGLFEEFAFDFHITVGRSVF